MRKPAAGAHRVDLHTSGRGVGEQPDPDEQGDPEEGGHRPEQVDWPADAAGQVIHHDRDRKSTRLNSSHVRISYAVFCLKKKKNNKYLFFYTKKKKKKKK